jgi:hypothetical protein
MSIRSHQTASPSAVRVTNWLTALEQELKSRVGWIDEAVSPFAGRRRRRTKIASKAQPTIERSPQQAA